MTLLQEPTLLLNLFYAMLFGIFIGFERQLHSRLQILRTTTLISVGAALFTNLGTTAFESSDPSRVAAQIVSGIGFLGAGVIIQHGSTVTGLNTAATLWASAAVGALAGAGRADITLAGMLLIFLANIALRPIIDNPHVTNVHWAAKAL